jgi:hypothetical protein
MQEVGSTERAVERQLERSTRGVEEGERRRREMDKRTSEIRKPLTEVRFVSGVCSLTQRYVSRKCNVLLSTKQLPIAVA